MNHTTLKLIFPAAIAALSLAWPALGANDRSWVSTNGSDSNPCTAASPCKTFQHTHDLTNPGGEVDVLAPGDYGTLVISKSITIDGGGMGYIEVGPAVGVVVNSGRISTVILRNLDIHGVPVATSDAAGSAGGGIYWEGGQTLYLQNVNISQTSQAFYMSQTMVGPKLFVTDTTISGVGNQAGAGGGFDINGSAGLEGNGKVTAVFDHVSFLNEYTGLTASNATVNVSRSLIAQCNVGVFTQTGGEVNIMNSEVASNSMGLNTGAQASFGLIRLGGNNIHDNEWAIYGYGSSISYGDNHIAGSTISSSETAGSNIPLK